MVEKALRAQVEMCLERKVFLRLDREGRALYVTDFPRRYPAECPRAEKALSEQGFSVTPAGKDKDMWRIDMTESRWQQHLRLWAEEAPVLLTDDTAPLLHLAALYERNETESVDTARKILLAHFLNQEKEWLFRTLSRDYAYALRKGDVRPGKGCAGLIRLLLKGTRE